MEIKTALCIKNAWSVAVNSKCESTTSNTSLHMYLLTKLMKVAAGS